MGKIQELSVLLTNQIAAGEVVERPSSVVKELIENAIDANSTKIDVHISEGGLSKIQVIDNGDGIEQEDALLAFKRHATSKLYTKEDLFRIKTLGFRGEALPSIASVSYITLDTSTGEHSGTHLVLKAGEVIEHTYSSSRKGTSITVEQLFFNTPARLKFVATLQRETAHIADLINRLALSHPHIAFTLISDGNQMLKTIGNGQLQQTIAGVYSPTIARQMKYFEAEDLDFKVKGYTTLPEVTRSNRNYMSIFVNGRYIKNYAISNAIIEGYESKLMIGRFPISVIDITMDYALVDVNVHPTKQQVRISKEKELGLLIKQAISQVMNDTVRIPSSIPKRFVQDSEQTDIDIAPLMLETQKPVDDVQEIPYVSYDNVQDDSISISKNGKDELPVFVDNSQSTHIEMVEETQASYKTLESKNRFPELHYFGQMHGTYLFAENQDGLYMIDQHAAQERIKYEYYREKIGELGQEKQGMLMPLVLNYPMNDYLMIKEKQLVLEEVGITLQPFGQTSFILEEHPMWIKEEQLEDTIRDLIAMLLEKGNVSIAKFREDTAIMMSCKKSIKANYYLNEEQARALLVDLAKCDNPYNCPHGRPVLIHLSHTDLEKMFKRIQDR
ncbi:DNA mismatch repair endonuclease MutL [Carnobacteriaceae bacterium zg-ZUI78]|uniref:DNA mismatch repair endonuclease MutL n=1 Tax=Granulicatella sp. zg-84 TaxID=2678503 RepID=UPI0013C138A9|nr:DNA mismatch repair endonuclease MutL [Granulicatella sp. zg-84]MBS4750873.1 DNA mismatch repair endonuclease MutL [Carnobacteriaceae bacterium zg-ZUI78]NEW65560.1 DNA mismatch repair endonuclease MutL [Granulicatella sp. zg-84]QMI85559.1 DNA mismatch repair endonuclease MutL [Carnobacteriaceae bacterium zg-84]